MSLLPSEKKIYSVKQTIRRDKASGSYIVQLNQHEIKRLSVKSGQFVVVILNDDSSELHIKSSIAKVLLDNDLNNNECRIDLTIRKRFKILELDDDNYYGTISVYKLRTNLGLKNKIIKFIIWMIHLLSLYSIYKKVIRNNPRTILLNVRRMQREDIEKNLSVIHEKYVALMGLDYNKYITIKSPVKLKDGSFKIGKISTRIFPGVDDTIDVEQYDGSMEEEPYPDKEKIYLDPESRYKLGLIGLEDRYEKSWPIVLVEPDITKFILERMMYYIVSFFILVRQFMGLINAVIILNIFQNIMLASLIAIWVITFIIYVEVRNKTHY